MSEWIEFDCGDEDRKRPVDCDAIVDIRLRNGMELLAKDNKQRPADFWDWSNDGFNGDIVAYRVIE